MGGKWTATVWFGDPELDMSLCSCTPRSFEAVWVWCVNMRHAYPRLEHFHIDMVKDEEDGDFAITRDEASDIIEAFTKEE